MIEEVVPQYKKNLPQYRLKGEEKTAYYKALGAKGQMGRRANQSFRETASFLCSKVVNNPASVLPEYLLQVAHDSGYEQLTYQQALTISMVVRGLQGDTKAFELIKDVVEPANKQGALNLQDTENKCQAFTTAVLHTMEKYIPDMALLRQAVGEVQEEYNELLKNMEVVND